MFIGFSRPRDGKSHFSYRKQRAYITVPCATALACDSHRHTGLSTAPQSYIISYHGALSSFNNNITIIIGILTVIINIIILYCYSYVQSYATRCASRVSAILNMASAISKAVCLSHRLFDTFTPWEVYS